MSNNSVVSDWDNDYARIARAAAQLRATTNSPYRRSSKQQQQQHNPAINRDSILTGLHRLTTRLGHLEPALHQQELDRRRILIQSLTQQLNSTNYNNYNNNHNNNQNNNHTMDFAEQQQQQQTSTLMAMREQDDMLDELASGVGRLKDQSKLINEESKMHVGLLDRIETGVEEAHMGLENETKRAFKIKEDQSVCRLYAIICMLSVLLFILILSGLS